MSVSPKAIAITPNPAVDVTYVIDDLRTGEVNRVRDVQFRPGGKGLNVAGVLAQLGHRVLATGFLGGAGGSRMRELLTDAPFEHRWTGIGGETRSTVAVFDGDEVTMLNEPGPAVSGTEWAELTAAVAASAEPGDVVAISGSIPGGTAENEVLALLSAAREAGSRTVLDTSGPLLAAAAPLCDVVKPNREELLAATGASTVADGASMLLARGARAVFVSAGPKGMDLYLGSPDGPEAWHASPAEVVAGNPTGAGDAALAALVAHLLGPSADELSLALPTAVALSAAAVLVPVAGRVDLDAYNRFLPDTRLERTRAAR